MAASMAFCTSPSCLVSNAEVASSKIINDLTRVNDWACLWNKRIANDRTANCNSLLLATTQLKSTVAHPGAHAFGEGTDEAPTLGTSCRIVHIPLGGAKKAIAATGDSKLNHCKK